MEKTSNVPIPEPRNHPASPRVPQTWDHPSPMKRTLNVPIPDPKTPLDLSDYHKETWECPSFKERDLKCSHCRVLNPPWISLSTTDLGPSIPQGKDLKCSQFQSLKPSWISLTTTRSLGSVHPLRKECQMLPIPDPNPGSP